MRVVPNDNQQALSIVEQIQRNGGGKIAILSAGDYDTRYAVKSLTRVIAGETGSPPQVIEPESPDIQLAELIKTITSRKPDHLVIPFDAPFLKDLVIALRAASPALNIYGTLHFTMGIEKRGSLWKDYEGVYMVRPCFDHTRYPELASSSSAYIFDAINLLVHAIRQVGTDRVDITDYISSSSYSAALTGSISFDELGNRQDASTLIRIHRGLPQLITHP
jgi:ABC-type branched-subunit amino acid transport system substrate-binding protein